MASSRRDTGRRAPFPAGLRERGSRRQPPRRSSDDNAEKVQAPSPRADGEDRGELYGGAPDADRRRSPTRPAARVRAAGLGGEDPGGDRARLGRVARAPPRLGRRGPDAYRDRALGARGARSRRLVRAVGDHRLGARQRARPRTARRWLRGQRLEDRPGRGRAALRLVHRPGAARALAPGSRDRRADRDPAPVSALRLGGRLDPSDRLVRGARGREEQGRRRPREAPRR